MATTTISVRLDAKLKKDALVVANKLGLSMGEVFTHYLGELVATKKLSGSSTKAAPAKKTAVVKAPAKKAVAKKVVAKKAPAKKTPVKTVAKADVKPAKKDKKEKKHKKEKKNKKHKKNK